MAMSAVAKRKKKPAAKHKKPVKAGAGHVRPKVHIYADDCMVVEQAVHAGRARDGGYVEFIAETACTIHFLDTSVFGVDHEYESFGDGEKKKLKVITDSPVVAEYEIVGCESDCDDKGL